MLLLARHKVAILLTVGQRPCTGFRFAPAKAKPSRLCFHLLSRLPVFLIWPETLLAEFPMAFPAHFIVRESFLCGRRALSQAPGFLRVLLKALSPDLR